MTGPSLLGICAKLQEQPAVELPGGCNVFPRICSISRQDNELDWEMNRIKIKLKDNLIIDVADLQQGSSLTEA